MRCAIAPVAGRTAIAVSIAIAARGRVGLRCEVARPVAGRTTGQRVRGRRAAAGIAASIPVAFPARVAAALAVAVARAAGSARPGRRAAFEVLGFDVRDVEEAVAADREVDERSLDRRLEVDDASFVDVAGVALVAGSLDVKLFENAVLDDGDPAFLGLFDVDQHFFLHAVSFRNFRRVSGVVCGVSVSWLNAQARSPRMIAGWRAVGLRSERQNRSIGSSFRKLEARPGQKGAAIQEVAKREGLEQLFRAGGAIGCDFQTKLKQALGRQIGPDQVGPQIENGLAAWAACGSRASF